MISKQLQETNALPSAAWEVSHAAVFTITAATHCETANQSPVKFDGQGSNGSLILDDLTTERTAAVSAALKLDERTISNPIK